MNAPLATDRHGTCDPWRLPGEDFQSSPEWFSLLAATCPDPGAHVRWLDLPGAGQPSGPRLAVWERTARMGPFAVRTLAGLTSCYTSRYEAAGLLAPDAAAVLMAALRKASLAGRVHRLLFDALPPGTGLAMLEEGLRSGGWLVERFRHFGNWHLPVEGDFQTYWASRGSRLRHTVERRERKLRAMSGFGIRVFTAPDDAEEATRHYQHVYRGSWKEPEPHPDFIPALIGTLLARNAGLVGVLSIGGTPAAAQIWTGGGGRATLFKLAHDDRLKQHSPGTVLTRHMLERVMGAHGVTEIDFGRGDDPYKSEWMPLRRQTWGLAAYNPSTPAGLALAAANLAPRWIRRWNGTAPGDAAPEPAPATIPTQVPPQSRSSDD